MSTLPVEQKTAKPAESVEERFRRFAAVWQAETVFVSSSSDMVAHPAFQEMVSMGPAIIPLLLRGLENRSGHWHRVLRQITGADPIPPADKGNVEKVGEAWLRWGKEHGYEW